MNKNDQQIMVIPRENLFQDQYFTGFQPAQAVDFEARILDGHQTMQRGPAENDPGFQQPIGYAILINPGTRQIFAYQRAAKAGQYDEKRLMGKWSWGVGGHIEPADIKQGGHPIRDSMIRELTEETTCREMAAPKILGYINDDDTEVGKVHFGILYVVETPAREVGPGSPELANGRFYGLAELADILADETCEVETWSALAFPALSAVMELECQRYHTKM